MKVKSTIIATDSTPEIKKEDEELEIIALQAFKAAFSGYAYPFKSSDDILQTKDDGYRAMYYEKAKSLTENEVLLQEIENWKKTLYAKLALTSMTDMERTAYRATLISIKDDFEKRLRSLADRVKSLEIKSIPDQL